MGADIHLYLEKKLSTDVWVTVQTFNPIGRLAVGLESRNPYDWMFFELSGRNYALFAKLAGVRGEGPDPKGIPDDASLLYRHYVREWASDGHSYSWCSAPEFVTLYLETMDSQSTMVKHYAKWVLDRGRNAAVLTFLDTYCATRVEEDDDANNYRFVFFFDN